MSFTDILYERPSFSEGVSRIFDWFGGLNDYNVTDTPAEADAQALAADWHTVGDDLRNAIDNGVALSDPHQRHK